jgi:hypothetical protein
LKSSASKDDGSSSDETIWKRVAFVAVSVKNLVEFAIFSFTETASEEVHEGGTALAPEAKEIREMNVKRARTENLDILLETSLCSILLLGVDANAHHLSLGVLMSIRITV